MKMHITNIEIVLDNIIYKVYFPILTKSKNLKTKSQILNIESSELENYIYYILNNYNIINIELSENYKIDNYFNLPLVKFIVSNIKLFKSLSLLVALITNILILSSYSNFNTDVEGCKIENQNDNRMCASFFFMKEHLKIRGIIYFF